MGEVKVRAYMYMYMYMHMYNMYIIHTASFSPFSVCFFFHYFPSFLASVLYTYFPFMHAMTSFYITSLTLGAHAQRGLL